MTSYIVDNILDGIDKILSDMLLWGLFSTVLAIIDLQISFVYDKFQKYPIQLEAFPLKNIKFGDIITLSDDVELKFYHFRGREAYLKVLKGRLFDDKRLVYVDKDYLCDNAVSLKNEYAIKWQKER